MTVTTHTHALASIFLTLSLIFALVGWMDKRVSQWHQTGALL